MRILILLLALSLAGCASEGSIGVHFCPSCAEALASLILNASSFDCAFYSLSDPLVLDAISRSNASRRFVFDRYVGIDGRVKGKYAKGLMHNKFCVFDESVVFTGSYNPNSLPYLNNVLVIDSRRVAKNYLSEFDELYSGTFGKGKKTFRAEADVNGSLVETYFCPEDDCRGKALDALKSAESSIYFFVFSFTDDGIAKVLLEKDVVVRGIMESSQNSQWSVYEKLKDEIDVELYEEGVMHNKVFVIDNSTVITGSWNPTKNGSENNDENMLIIHDERIAMMYVEEFLSHKH